MPLEEEGGAYVSPNQIDNELRRLRDGVVRLQTPEYDDRLRALERRGWRSPGGAAAFGAVASHIIQLAASLTGQNQPCCVN